MAEKKSKPLNQANAGEETEPQATTEKDRKRFCLRDEMAEVKLLLENDERPEDKCSAIHRRYQTIARDYKRLEKRLVECQRKQIEVAQHRDIIQNEYARANLAKTKLESLCRELQRHSKAVAEESKQRQREEEERRNEVSAKFQTTINEITLKMQEHHQRNQTLRLENLEMATKMKELVEQYKAREEHYDKLVKHKQLEVQLYEAKMEQLKVMVAEEKQSSLEERQMLLEETLKQQTRCEQLTHQEADLRGQLSLYSEKFDEFQSTLTKSNDVFNTFKKEMDKMSKTIAALEKEMLIWKKRYEKCNKALMEMTNERGIQEQALQTLRSKNEKLEKLCRALQAERTELNSRKDQLEERCRALQSDRDKDQQETETVENAVEKEAELLESDHTPNCTDSKAAAVPPTNETP